MARTPIIAGNWKMNTDAASARDLVEGIKAARVDALAGVEKVLCPPFVYLQLVRDLTRGTSLKVGAQDMHWEEKGAFTGEISAAMVKDFAEYVIIGHSERRQLFGETDEGVRRKLLAAIGHGLTPIVCVGESLAQREAGETEAWLTAQVRASLAGVTIEESTRVAVAYEPIWAIGTGRTATPELAQAAIAHIRGVLAEHLAAGGMRILYGGSVTADNAAELLGQPDIDGALVGGASLSPETFAAIVGAA